jgi:ankyrin repeat protein
MPSTRKLLLDAIASLDAGAPPDVCANALDEIFSSCATDDGPAASDNESCADGGVTPLMIACDKSITSAMNYLRHQIQHQSMKEVSVWGGVTDKSSESGNCAAHHALAANFQIGLDVLEYYAFNATPLSSDKNDFQRYMSLLEQPNENGDTPIMMACVYGHSDILRHILKRICHLASTANNNSDSETIVKHTWQSLNELFEKRNEEGCSALNLACGHGHVDIVRLLIHTHSVCEKEGIMELNLSSTDDISEIESNERDAVHKWIPLVTVTYDDVRRCHSTIENLEYGLKMMKQNSVALAKQEEFQQQHKNALDCLEMLNNELDRIAAETAHSLLTQHEGKQDQSKPNVKTSTKKKKKKKKKKHHTKPKQHEKHCIDSSTTRNMTHPEKTRNGWCIETNGDANLVPSTATSPFITLHDGRVISKSQPPEDVPCEVDGSVDKLIPANPAPKTLESILQSSSRYDNNAATIMESLCLDPSMLLLSAHGMAMEMSPCQLDAIESILTKQLRASKEAQKIQSRLLNSNNV